MEKKIFYEIPSNESPDLSPRSSTGAIVWESEQDWWVEIVVFYKEEGQLKTKRLSIKREWIKNER